MKNTFDPPKMEIIRFSLNDSIASGCSYYAVWIGPNAQTGNNGTGKYTVYTPHGEVTETGTTKIKRMGPFSSDLDDDPSVVRSWSDGTCFSS